MSTYLEKHPPRAWQMGPTVNGVRVTTSPTCVLHTYQADWTAARGADYIRTRPDSAGYHHLTGLDQAIQLAPWNYATAHAIPVNVWAKGFSCMWFAGRWSQLSEANRRTLVHGMAKGVYEYSQWRVGRGMTPIIPRKISRAQAMRGENGIVYHGDLQADRTDPGNDFPLQMFLAELRRLQSGGTPASPAPVLEGEVMSASEVWNDRTPTDRVNDKNPSTMGNRVSRAHQYSWSIWQRIRDTEWGNWLAERVWMFRGLDYLNDSPTTQQAKLSRAHQYSFQARSEVRELKAMVKALAKAQDEGHGKILDAVENAERDAIKVTAAEVAAELEAETKLNVKED